MKIENLFKYLIIANIFLFISIILSFKYQSTTVIELSKNLDKGFFDTSAGLLIVIFILVLYIFALYCLYNFKKFGKNLFLYVVLFYIFCILLGKIQILNPLSYSLQYIATLTDGAILTLIYFSPIKDKFK
tara:strand:- start:89 stop:478 length:390 start_codon:yes stop_codon:yes gene_type:complete